ncbi:hypothetical protein LTR78_002787 [Recurvomyces mirabilis]|uniref:J domain-containing protein n=1 Tax=Recurvomyces mirabilis TaxID=574656 RepID=A0AAE0WTD2_9PEZI|nr:hypothetical protein LTR78_002787 [Recurvomyces mirabilis]KAK5159479.1 hypothetical protein LTS14_002621 [Recurvomyces mirabilis]
MSLTVTNTAELRELIKQDVEESRELQTQIDRLRSDLEQGSAPPEGNVLGHIESQSKKMSKELARRIEQIEEIPKKSASDREFLQALNARQVAWDRQIMQISEIADLMYEARKGAVKEGGDREEFLEHEQKSSKHGKQTFDGEATTAAVTVMPVPGADQPLPSVPTVAAKANPGSSSSEEAASNISERGSGSVVDDPEESPDYEDEFDEGEEYGEDNEFDEGDDYYEDEEEEIEPDRSHWPLCYRILDITPETPAADMEVAACQRLAPNHDPARLPNDPDAPGRWAAIVKARETLEDPERKAFYDMHGRTPSGLKEFDLSSLSIEDH